MNRDKNGRFMKATKELVIGDKIISFDQFKEGMIIDFEANVHDGTRYNWVKVDNAILVKNHNDNWHACHDNEIADGERPFYSLPLKDQLIKMFNKKYGWRMIDDDWMIDDEYDGIADSRNIIFKGYHSSLKDDKKATKELIIGDKIISFDQFKEGMIIDFEAFSVDHLNFATKAGWEKIENAILIRNEIYNDWYACHDNEKANGFKPFTYLSDEERLTKMLGKKYSWKMFQKSYRNIIFKGYHSSFKDDKKVEKVKPKYKINDIVLVRESLINDNRCCCRITNYIKEHGYTLSILTTPSPLYIYNFKEENIIRKIGIFVDED